MLIRNNSPKREFLSAKQNFTAYFAAPPDHRTSLRISQHEGRIAPVELDIDLSVLGTCKPANLRPHKSKSHRNIRRNRI